MPTSLGLRFRARRGARPLVSAALTAMAAVGCSGAPSSDAEGEASASEASSVLEPAAAAELQAAGFSPAEVQAVSDSIAISKRLGVQSFVDEANDGNWPADTAPLRRESHGKHQGCLRARFDVTAKGPGVFRAGASYPAWIRLSNGGAYQRDDKGQHISRGMGLKLLGVPTTPAGSQDFLFITSPRFFINDITHYPGFLKASGNGRLGFLWNLLVNMSLEEKEVIVHRLGLQVSNLLEAPEYSAVPYRFGDDVVKYAVAKCGGSPPQMPASHPPPRGASNDYLEEAMSASLSAPEGVCYDFFVQRPRGPQDPVDNPTRAWGGAFEKVARITIPAGQQRGGPADYRTNEAECERMAFDPWNATAENAPVGKTNWTRKFVYGALSRFRLVDFPKIYRAWLRNHDDPAVPPEYRRELARLKSPESVAPLTKETREPEVDDGFRKLGIVD